MLDDIRHGIRNSGRAYGAIARAAKVSERTVYGLFADDANPTINTLNALTDVLLDLPDQQRRPCDGCRHAHERDRLDFGAGETDVVLCLAAGRHRPDHGCSMRRT